VIAVGERHDQGAGMPGQADAMLARVQPQRLLDREHRQAAVTEQLPVCVDLDDAPGEADRP